MGYGILIWILLIGVVFIANDDWEEIYKYAQDYEETHKFSLEVPHGELPKKTREPKTFLLGWLLPIVII